MEALARRTARARVTLISLSREYQGYRDALLEACERVFSSMHLLGGEQARAFETEMAEYLGVQHVRGVASGTDALLLSIRAAGLEPGDEVLIQANAFVAAVEALRIAGVTPIPVDIRLDDLGPDPAGLAAGVTPRTRGIVVVHLHGLPVDMPPILELADANDLLVIEDCSHAHGATLDGRRVGSFGVAGAFSLGVVKNLAAYGDAGIVSTNDQALAEGVRLLGTHGQVGKNEHEFYGQNSRLDELHAAMLRVKLRALDVRNARRAAIASYYNERFAGLLATPPADPSRSHVFHQYVVMTPVREALRAHLAAHDVETGIHYPVPIHRQTAWLRAYGEAPALPYAERAAREMLSLPVHADLSDEEVERVADTVADFFRKMNGAGSEPALSLVVPVYNEEGNVASLHGELTRVARELGRPYEIVFVNDGSQDATRARLEALRTSDPCLRIVDLDGNFGEAAALSAGFAHARGALVVTLDGDGQNDPADIPRLLGRLEPGIDVVSGRRRERKEAFFSRVLPSRIANWLIARLTGVPVHDCGCGLKAYRRELLVGTQLPRGMNRFLPAILGVDPGRVVEVWVTDRPRGSGTSHYGLARTFVVLRDLLAIPLLVRLEPRTLGRMIGGAQAAFATLAVAGVVAALGWPVGRTSALLATLLAAAGSAVGWSVGDNVHRYLRAREHGVFRVRGVA